MRFFSLRDIMFFSGFDAEYDAHIFSSMSYFNYDTDFRFGVPIWRFPAIAIMKGKFKSFQEKKINALFEFFS